MRTIVLLAMLAFSGTTCFAGDRCCRVGLFARICERVSHRHDCCAPVEPVCCTPAPRHCEPHAECSMVCCLKCGHNHCKDVKCCNPCCPEKPDCGCKGEAKPVAAAAVTGMVCENGQCGLSPVPHRGLLSSAYQQALASAQYRAANRIHGHSYLDTHRKSGVGWASHDPQPTTCLGRGGSAYAIAKGPDGYYATKFSE